MGIDKALIEIEGRSLLARAAGKAARVCGSVSIVGDPERYGRLGLPVVADSYPGLGPLAGIEAALGATRAEANLVVACDMPSLNGDVFGQLFEALGRDGDAAVPQYADGRVEPLCAVYSRRIHPVIREALESGVRKVTDALRLLESGGFALRYLRVATSDAFENLNTPDDLSRYLGAENG